MEDGLSERQKTLIVNHYAESQPLVQVPMKLKHLDICGKIETTIVEVLDEKAIVEVWRDEEQKPLTFNTNLH